MAFTDLNTGLYGAKHTYGQWAISRDLAWRVDAVNEMTWWDGSNATGYVVPYKPAAAPTVATGAATGLTGDYYYAFAYYVGTHEDEATAGDGKFVQSSIMGPISATSALVQPSNQKVTVTIPTDPDAATTGTDKVALFRTVAGGTALFFHSIQTQNQAYADSLADSSLGAAAPTTNVRPPLFSTIASHKGYLFAANGEPYTTGTASVANGSANVTLSAAAAVNPGMVGMYFQVDGDSERYPIGTATAATSVITFDTDSTGAAVTYAGSTNTTASYSIYLDPRRLYYCRKDAGLFYPWHWPGTNILELDASFNDRIIGLIDNEDRLFVFGENNIWEVSEAGSGTDTFYIEPRVTGVGAVGKRAMCLTDEDEIYFLAGDSNIHVYAGSSQAPVVSQNIWPSLQSIQSTMRPYTHMHFDPKHHIIICCVGLDAADDFDFAFVYDLMTKTWWKWWFPFTAGAVVSGTLYLGDTEGRIYTFGTGNADGVTSGTTSGTATAATTTSLTDDDATFNTTGDGDRGAWVRITGGTGKGQIRQIQSNTATALTINAAWSETPDTTSTYTVGGIYSFWTSGDLGLGDIISICRRVDILHRTESTGTLTAEIMRDTSTTVMRSTTIDLTAAPPRRRWHVRQRGNKFAITIRNEMADEPWQVKELHLLVEPLRK